MKASGPPDGTGKVSKDKEEMLVEGKGKDKKTIIMWSMATVFLQVRIIAILSTEKK